MQQINEKEYKVRHDRVAKMIHWEMCKKLKFDDTKKWYIHNPESVLENATHKVLCDFEIQTDHQILAERPNQEIVKKKKKKKKKKEQERERLAE